MKKLSVLVLVLVIVVAIVGCASDAQVASQNLSQAADQFQLVRRVVFYNGFTADYMLSIEGRCSINADRADNQLEVTCKTGDNSYKKHFLGLADNISYFVEQLESAPADVYHYKVIFKPETIVPDIDLKMSK